MISDEERWASWQQADRLAGRWAAQFIVTFLVTLGVILALAFGGFILLIVLGAVLF
jgi:hypothetical protein